MNFDKLVTEQVNPESLNLDTMSTLDAAKLMNAMDAQVAQAVEKALPQVAQAVDVIAEHFRRGGRLLTAAVDVGTTLWILALPISELLVGAGVVFTLERLRRI